MVTTQRNDKFHRVQTIIDVTKMICTIAHIQPSKLPLVMKSGRQRPAEAPWLIIMSAYTLRECV